MVKKPHEVIAKLVHAPLHIFVEQEPMKVEEFWAWFQSVIGEYLNRALETIQTRSYELEQATKIQFSYLQWATQFLM